MYPGFCAVADLGGDCEYDSSGAWKLFASTTELRTIRQMDNQTRWRKAAEACASRCMGCERCSIVSFSLSANDCSWYNACNVMRLSQRFAGFATTFVRARPRVFLTPIESSQDRPPPQGLPEAWRPYGWMHDLAARGRPLLRGCRAAFLDLGSNTGGHISALYANASSSTQSGKRRSPAESVFAAAFGPTRDDVCAVALEPSPSHAPRLRALAARLTAAARRFYLFHAAVAANNSAARFYSDSDDRHHEWAASLTPTRSTDGSEGPSIPVPTVSLDYLLRQLFLGARRFIDAGAGERRPTVVVKLDIEGAEFEALPPAVEAICTTVDVLACELHLPGRGNSHGASLAGSRALLMLLHSMRERQRRGDCRTRVVQVPAGEHAEWREPSSTLGWTESERGKQGAFPPKAMRDCKVLWSAEDCTKILA